jgi:membrane-bound ClpP family serine protease
VKNLLKALGIALAGVALLAVGSLLCLLLLDRPRVGVPAMALTFFALLVWGIKATLDAREAAQVRRLQHAQDVSVIAQRAALRAARKAVQ